MRKKTLVYAMAAVIGFSGLTGCAKSASSDVKITAIQTTAISAENTTVSETTQQSQNKSVTTAETSKISQDITTASQATTEKQEASTKKQEATTKKQEATTKKQEATTKKQKATTKKQEVTTKKQSETKKNEASDDRINDETDVKTALDLLVEKAGELDTSDEYGIKSIDVTDTDIDEDSCTTILGLDTDEFNDSIEAAIESKPDGSWYTHSVVVIKVKDGVNVKKLAKKIVANTAPDRFGCLKPEAIVGGYAGNIIFFTASDSTICEAVYSAFEKLSDDKPVRIDRKNDWDNSSLFFNDGTDSGNIDENGSY